MRLVVFTALALLLAGCATDPAPSGEPSVGEPAQPGAAWTFTATDGATYTNETPPANATVLFFMATWCGSCRAKAPVLAAVHDDYVDKGVRTLSVDFDPTESPEDLARWQADLDQPWPHGVDTGLKLQRHFQVTTQSSVLVLDAEGDVVKRFGYGGLNEAAYRAALDAALAA